MQVLIDTDQGLVSHGGEHALLSRSETAVFRALLDVYPSIATREFIYRRLYQRQNGPEQKNIDVLVCRLRRLLAPLSLKISTRHGVGYALASAGDGEGGVLSEARMRREAVRESPSIQTAAKRYAARPRAPGRAELLAGLDARSRASLNMAAAMRGFTAGQLASTLLSLIARDNLYAAVLDDGRL